jgi:hypothetical protein
MGRDEGKDEADIAPVGFLRFVPLRPRRPLDGGGRRRSSRAEERAQRLELVGLLDLLHARKVRLAANHLRACERPEQIALPSDHALDARRRCDFPGRRGHQVAVPVVAVEHRAGIVEDVATEVVPLAGIEPRRLDLGHARHPRLGAPVQPGVRIRRIVVGSDDVEVGGRREPEMHPLAKPAVALNGLHVHGLIVHHQRVGEHVGIRCEGSNVRCHGHGQILRVCLLPANASGKQLPSTLNRVNFQSHPFENR